jgi:hypothetical protein
MPHLPSPSRRVSTVLLGGFAGALALITVFGTGCATGRGEVAACSVVLRSERTGERVATSNLDWRPRVDGFWVCGTPTVEEVQRTYTHRLQERLLDACMGTGDPLFCHGGPWCREAGTLSCRVNTPVGDGCVPAAADFALPVCPATPMPGLARLCVNGMPYDPMARPTVDFGPVPVGQLESRSVTLTNCGSGVLTLAPPTAMTIQAGMGSQSSFLGTGLEPTLVCEGGPLRPAEMMPPMGFRLGAGERASCALTVRFRPFLQGARTAEARVEASTDPMATLQLQGAGIAGQLAFNGRPATCVSGRVEPPLPKLCLNTAETVGGMSCWSGELRLGASTATVTLLRRPTLNGAFEELTGLGASPVPIAPGASATLRFRSCAPRPVTGSINLPTNGECNSYPLPVEASAGCVGL